jgi:tetratricopeptide (TPR) repeat protein
VLPIICLYKNCAQYCGKSGWPMRMLTIAVSSLAFLLIPAWCDEGHHHTLTENEVGSVHFTTSCSKAIEGKFNHAVALLHSFQYEQAREAFEELFSLDSNCAMAQWGVAMSHYHGLWDNGDEAAGRQALQKAKEIAGANPETTTREKAYINALAEIYRTDGKNQDENAHAFEQAMGALQAAYPEDSEAAIFHALTLAITAPKTDKTYANQRKCGEILEPIFATHPHHPGVAHYIIHCYDNPVLAEQGLKAARMYASIAPASAHANHMPSHIFTLVGSWDESIASNKRSAQLAAEAENSSKNGEARDQRLHAMDYLEYAYLQSGRVKQAENVLAEMNSLPAVAGVTLTNDYAVAAIPARYATELGNWKQASGLQVNNGAVNFTQAITWLAVGVGSARSGNLERAREAERALASLRDAIAAQKNDYWSAQVEVQRREVAAWISETSGKTAETIDMLRSAVDLEESMDKNAVTPGAVIPAREMLAAFLLKENHPQEALSEFEAVLKIAPNRFNALYGAASAADASGNSSAANRYFQKLTETAVGDERPELVTARKRTALLTPPHTQN